jgi:hypothetical protein
MNIRNIDLDGSIAAQQRYLAGCRPATFSTRWWGPRIRLGCRFRRFRRFERALTKILGSEIDTEPALTFCGSGDFHHVSLALLRRQPQPFNLLVLDNHPDWMWGAPILHCGTWLYHAARLPLVRQIYHVGGDVDFDNYLRWLAPWSQIRTGKITVFPARRCYQRGSWAKIAHQCLRPDATSPLTAERAAELVHPLRDQLAQYPLYVSVDKDVLTADEAITNWDSGHLTLEELRVILAAFLNGSNRNLAGMDTVGDWSSPCLRGLVRRALHLTEHPRLKVNADDASQRNARINLALVDSIQNQNLRASA